MKSESFILLGVLALCARCDSRPEEFATSSHALTLATADASPNAALTDADVATRPMLADGSFSVYDSGPPLFVNQILPAFDGSAPVPDLHALPPPIPHIDLPSPASAICARVNDPGLCPADFPNAYACTRSSAPTTCVASGALGRNSQKIVCCK